MKRQPNSRMCFVCGLENPIGFKLIFQQDEERVWTEFTPQEEHQGWPGIMHGGLVCTLLDEVMARSFFFDGEERWMMTVKMEVRYLKPVPIGVASTLVGGITRLTKRLIEAWGEIRLADGSLAARGGATYVQAPKGLIGTLRQESSFWRAVEG